MAEDEERLSEDRITESIPRTMVSSELPGKKVGISMEVPLFLIMLGFSISGTAVSNIILYRTCVHALDHSVEECKYFLSPNRSNSNETQHLEEEVQKYTTFVSSVKMVLESLVPAVLSMFLGVWSDTHGRKPLVVWPLFGLSFSSLLLVLYCVLDNLGPWWYILTAIPFSLTGGFIVVFTGAFCFLSDVTTTSNRSLRMTLLEASISLGGALGSVSSSYLLQAVGNVNLLLISASLNVAAYAFTNIYIQESLTGALRGGITSVLDFLLVKEMIRECFKRRPNNGRAQILFLTIANSLSVFILYGLGGLEYMYTREKLHWEIREYTIYSASSTTLSFFGALIGVGLIQRMFKVSDLAFALVAFITETVDYTIRAFAVQTWHMYLGASISIFKGLSAPLIRSLITKTLPIEDIAKVFSLMCTLEGLCPLFAPVMYNSLYSLTIETFPGAIYIFCSGIGVVCVVLLGYLSLFYYCVGGWIYPSTYLLQISAILQMAGFIINSLFYFRTIMKMK